MRFDYQILLKSPPLNLLAGSAPGLTYLRTHDHFLLMTSVASSPQSLIIIMTPRLTTYVASWLLPEKQPQK